MEFHPIIESRMKAIQEILNAVYAGGGDLPSNVSGREREVFLNAYLSQLFPNTLRFGSGSITDVKGNQSGQLDIVVERPFAVSLPLPLGDERLFLADNVGAVIEVKSNLVSQWGNLEKTTRKVLELEYQELFAGMSIGNPVKKIPVFAVGYTGHKTVEGLKKRLHATPIDGRPNGVLCLDSGCFVFEMPEQEQSCYASGAMGLFLFTSVLNNQLNRILANSPPLNSYLTI